MLWKKVDGKRWIIFNNTLEDIEKVGNFQGSLTFMGFDNSDNFDPDKMHFHSLVYTPDDDDMDYDDDEECYGYDVDGVDRDLYPYRNSKTDDCWSNVAITDDNITSSDKARFEQCWNMQPKTKLSDFVQKQKALENVGNTNYNKGIGDTNMANVNANVDVGSLMNMKMVEKLIEKDDFDIKDIMEYQMKMNIVQGITDGRGINLTDIMRQKIATKFMLNGDEKDMSISQLAILGMLQNNTLDINQLLMIKMLDKMDKEEVKK